MRRAVLRRVHRLHVLAHEFGMVSWSRARGWHVPDDARRLINELTKWGCHAD